MDSGWQASLLAGDIALIDGGTGSQLQSRGVPVSRICWNATAGLSHHDTLVAVHVDFIEAGADVITTNTFATHRYLLEAAGLAADYLRINEATITAARRARVETERPVALAGAMSCLPPGFDVVNYPNDTIARAAYVEHAEMLAGFGVDLIILEMMQDIKHSTWAYEAASATGLPVWLGISCKLDTPSKRLVAYDFPDVSLDSLLSHLIALKPDAINIMHSPVDAIPPALQTILSRWNGVLGVYPELGSFDVTTRTRTAKVEADAFQALAKPWLECGVQIIGGCCGAGPAHIAALKRLIASIE